MRIMAPKAVALVLAAAAFAKLLGLGGGALPGSGILADVGFQLAVVEIELALACWLFIGSKPVGAWLTALATFGVFALVSLWHGLQGQTSCGCFGAIQVNPWFAFGLDVFIVAALLVGRPDLTALWTNPRTHFFGAAKLATLGGIGLALFLGLEFGFAYFAFGSPKAAIAYFRGERISVSPRLVDLGEGCSGQELEAKIELSNWTDLPVRLIGGTKDCSCTVLDDLPVTIPAKESRAVSIRMRLAGRPGIFNRKGAFLVDDGGFGRVEFRLTGRILEAKEKTVALVKTP